MMWLGMMMSRGSSMPPALEKRMRYSPICAYMPYFTEKLILRLMLEAFHVSEFFNQR